MSYGVRTRKNILKGYETGGCKYLLVQGDRAEGVKIESVKQADFDVQLFFKLTDESITPIPFASNLFDFTEKVHSICNMFLTLSQK